MIYDYKTDKIVQDIITDNLIPVIEDVKIEFDRLRRGECIGIYTPSSIAKEILASLFEDMDELFVDEESEVGLLLGDKNEILITVWNDGRLFIENAIGNDSYLISCGGVINYVYDGFKKRDLDKITEYEDPILVFGLSDKIEDEVFTCTDSTESVRISKTKDGRLTGFTKSWTTSKNGNTCYSSYSHYSEDEDMIKKIAKDFGIKIK